eukprot:c2329_g1_i1 orf=354-713(+)
MSRKLRTLCDLSARAPCRLSVRSTASPRFRPSQGFTVGELASRGQPGPNAEKRLISAQPFWNLLTLRSAVGATGHISEPMENWHCKFPIELIDKVHLGTVGSTFVPSEAVTDPELGRPV